jgi:Resolvase, N terminal domain
MNNKITPDHLGRIAVVYVRQSTMAQVMGNLESQRRQYDLAGAAEGAGFKSVTVIDDDLGRSGSGGMQRPGFERLVAMVCSGGVSPNRRKFRQVKLSSATIASRSIICPLSRKV